MRRETTGIRQVRPSNVERHARRAIARRIGCAGDAVVSVQRDEAKPGSVVLHLNSGGNALAAACELRIRGYSVEPAGYDAFAPGNYGAQLRVSPRTDSPCSVWGVPGRDHGPVRAAASA